MRCPRQVKYNMYPNVPGDNSSHWYTILSIDFIRSKYEAAVYVYLLQEEAGKYANDLKRSPCLSALSVQLVLLYSLKFTCEVYPLCHHDSRTYGTPHELLEASS
jgi:hypothetical protein